MEAATKRITFLEAKTDDLENRGRRKNLRIFGLKEGAEGDQTLLNFMMDMLPKWLELPPEKSFILERVHRTLASGKPNQNRVVLVRFQNFQDKELVYRMTRKLEVKHDGTKITFAQDLSAETIRVRRGFHPIIQLFVNINAFRGFLHNPCRLRIFYNRKMHPNTSSSSNRRGANDWVTYQASLMETGGHLDVAWVYNESKQAIVLFKGYN